MVTRQLQVERRTAKERWPETDVLPLSHADQLEITLVTAALPTEHDCDVEYITIDHCMTVNIITINRYRIQLYYV